MIKLKNILTEASVKIDDKFNDELIDRVNDEYAKNYTTLTPEQINDGYCDIWAQLFIEKFGGKQNWSFEFPTGGCGHHWVELNNKFYDAETPEGVSSIKQLPFFKRAIKQYGTGWVKAFYDDIKA